MSLNFLPSLQEIDDFEEFPTKARLNDPQISTLSSFSTLPTLDSLSEIGDVGLTRLNSMDKIRSNLKNKLAISLPQKNFGSRSSVDNTLEEKRQSYSECGIRETKSSLSEIFSGEQLLASPDLLRFLSVCRKYKLASEESLNKRENLNLLSNLGELARKEIVSDDTLDVECATIHFSFGEFWNNFKKDKILGQGCAGVVRKCSRISNPNEVYAVKIVSTNGDDESILKTIREYKKCQGLKHKNIVNVFELHIDLVADKSYLLMEFVEGQELQSHLDSIKNFDEETAAEIFREIMCGIQYLHSMGVVHRDIKLENIMVSNDFKTVKLADLNVSRFFEKSEEYSSFRKNNYKMWTYTGTVAFLAPEVFLDLEYSEAIDVWGAGVVLYTMLCGELPFRSEYQDNLIKKIEAAELKFRSKEWDNVSDSAKDLITYLLQKDTNLRFTPFEAISHEWTLKKGRIASENLDSSCEEELFSPAYSSYSSKICKKNLEQILNIGKVITI